MTARTNFPGVKQGGGNPSQVALAINQLLLGKMNCTLAVTLRTSNTTTVIADPRINATSVILLMPTTAHAAAEIGNGTLYVSSVSKGTATLTHASNSQADRTFILVILA